MNFRSIKEGDAQLFNVKSKNMIAVQVRKRLCHGKLNDHINTYLLINNDLIAQKHVVELSNVDYTQPPKAIIKGASSGLMIIHEIYDLDVGKCSKGQLNLQNCIFKSRKVDSLKPDDLTLMSSEAFNNRWYDTSLKYLGVSITMFNQLSDTERFPSRFQSTLLNMRKEYSKYHNIILMKSNDILGHHEKLFPYKRVCGGKTKKHQNRNRSSRHKLFTKCYLVHHVEPYLKLGPFHFEVKLFSPFRTIIHDFFTSKEMDWIINYSKPRLSIARDIPMSNTQKSPSERRYSDGKDGHAVSKTVQMWFDDIRYTTEQEYLEISAPGEPLMFEPLPLINPYNFTIEHSIMLSVSKRIELVTQFNITKRNAGSSYQTTNYGLAGLVEEHNDSWGYESDGVRLVEERAPLVSTGDYIATFMGWLEDVGGGGRTAFIHSTGEDRLAPNKGSAAFWINMYSCHKRDPSADHVGCPVLKGSKWIINKWINSFDQWKDWPCGLKPTLRIKPFRSTYNYAYHQ